MSLSDPINPDNADPLAIPGQSDVGLDLLAEQHLANIGSLMSHLDEAPLSEDWSTHQNRLVQVRLGIASALYWALRIRHRSTADHSLRVALTCSRWAAAMDLGSKAQDEVEMAALLHDIGKIGIPDSILRSPRPLSSDEAAIMAETRKLGKHILASCCTSQPILDIISNAPAWFDGSRPGFTLTGEDIPIGARMISIADAFDSMTTDHVFRAAKTRERSLAELYSCAGTQFDPLLVEDFVHLQSNYPVEASQEVLRGWLRDLTPEAVNSHWRRAEAFESPEAHLERLFHSSLLESMHNGVIFVRHDLTISKWNRGAERLSNIRGESVMHRSWSPSLLGARDSGGAHISDDDCPVAYAISSGTQSLQRMMIKGRRDDYINAKVHIVPIVSPQGQKLGATITITDASPEADLEERVQSLHEKATRDPLTGIANRAEFDRVLELTVAQAIEKSSNCSLVICDIDHFKHINDTYGHQTGDEVLIQFAALLQRTSRHGDLVARYGGEEFVMICEDCSAPYASELSEKIRTELAAMRMPAIHNTNITASFGVTELQPGDSAETMLRRADRALYQAKDSGRNRVIELGSGMRKQEASTEKQTWWSSLIWSGNSDPNNEVANCCLSTNVPVNVAAQKLRGFVADHDAEIDDIAESTVTLRLNHSGGTGRRQSDKAITYLVELTFETTHTDETAVVPQHIIHVRIRTANRQRDRRDTLESSARAMINSLRSYMIAEHCDPPA